MQNYFLTQKPSSRQQQIDSFNISVSQEAWIQFNSWKLVRSALRIILYLLRRGAKNYTGTFYQLQQGFKVPIPLFQNRIKIYNLICLWKSLIKIHQNVYFSHNSFPMRLCCLKILLIEKGSFFKDGAHSPFHHGQVIWALINTQQRRKKKLDVKTLEGSSIKMWKLMPVNWLKGQRLMPRGRTQCSFSWGCGFESRLYS